MAQDTHEHTTHRPASRSDHAGRALSVGTPAGWAFEQLVLSSLDRRTRLDVRTERAHPAEAPAAFADRRARVLGELFGGYAQESAREQRYGPSLVYVRRFSWGWEAEGRREGVEAFRLAGERAIVATLLPEAELAPDAEDALAGMVGAFELEDAVPVLSRTYSVEELAVLAELVGQPSYPGTGEHRLGSAAERLTARRALVARGTVGGDGNGGLSVNAGERRLLGAPLAAAAVVSAERRSRRGRETRVFHVTPTISVMQTGRGAGLQQLTGFPTVGLVRRLGEFLGLDEPAPAGTGEPVALERGDFERSLEAALSGIGEPHEALRNLRSAFAVRLLRREGTRHLGGTLHWLDRGDGGLWLADEDQAATRLRPAAGAEVLDRLRSLMA